MMLLRARSLAMGYSGCRPEVAETIAALLNARLTPVVPEHGSLGASGDLAPLAHCGLALMGEGEIDLADGGRRPAAEALAAAGIEPLTLTAKEGLALINGTDGILAMLVLASWDLRRLLQVADVTAAMSVEALLGTDRAFAEDLIALRPAARTGGERAEPAPPARRVGDRRQSSLRRPARPGRLLAAMRAPGQRRRARRPRARRAGGRDRARLGDRQPDGARGRAHRVLRQLPRRAARPRLRPARDRRRRGRGHRRASHRPPPRREPLSRPPALPRRGPRRRLGADDRPLHAGGDGGREPPARGAGERRLAADQRDAGGPRLDGVGRRAQAAPRRSPTWAGSSASSSPVRRGASTCAPRSSRRPARRRPSRVCGRWRRARGPTGGSRPSSPRSSAWSSPGRSSRRSKLRSGGLE